MPLCAFVLYYLYRHDNQDLLLEARDILDHIEAAYFGHFDLSFTYLPENTISRMQATMMMHSAITTVKRNPFLRREYLPAP